MSLTPTQLGAAVADAVDAFVADPSPAGLVALSLALKDAFEDYDDFGAFTDQIKALIAQNVAIVDSFRFMVPDGFVALSDNLPAGAPDGAFWIVTGGPNAGHGFLRVAGNWGDLGLIRGPAGVTPDLSFTITAVEPGVAASASVTGTPEEPNIHLSLPRGRNARTNIAAGFTNAASANEVIGLAAIDQATTFSPVNSRAKAKVAAGVGGATIAILKNGAAWGTITFAAGSLTGAFTIAAPTAADGDLLEFIAPATATTLANVAINLVGAD